MELHEIIMLKGLYKKNTNSQGIPLNNSNC